ncbi:MAG: redox-regulated ATPase YchF [Halobacteriota archaeon]
MSPTIALAGKPNTGKSTFFKAATLADVEIANYPFTTINANRGIAHVRSLCPCNELESRCTFCINGTRFIPIELIDVAGLVPEAHKGRGLGNAFLDNLRQAEAIINVIDASGSTDIEGNILGTCSHDPLEDVYLLDKELSLWIAGIIRKNWQKLAKRAEVAGVTHSIADQLAGLNITEYQAKAAMSILKLNEKQLKTWTEHDIVQLSGELRQRTKPIVVAANKKDVASEQALNHIASSCEDVVKTSGEAELALRLAAQKKLIDYVPGDNAFQILKRASEQQTRALERLQHFIAGEGTGVQACLNKAVFDVLQYIVVYPVEDEHRFSDKAGNILPDAFLLKKGQTVRDLAFKVHTDIGRTFLYGMDARTKRRLGEHHELADGDIIKIVAATRSK